MSISEMAQKLEKKLYVWDTCIWIGYGKLSLLQRKYLSSGVNMLTNSLKILDITNRDIFKLNFPQRNEEYDRSAVMQISQVFRNF